MQAWSRQSGDARRNCTDVAASQGLPAATEAARGREWVLPQNPQKEHWPADPLVPAQCYSFQTSGP